MTDWVTVDQQRIDKFAEATGDYQWIHVDVERAKTSRTRRHDCAWLPDAVAARRVLRTLPQHAFPFCDLGLNYGLNRSASTSPVRSGSRLRGRFVLAKVDEVEGGLQLTCNITVEIEAGHAGARRRINRAEIPRERSALIAMMRVRAITEPMVRAEYLCGSASTTVQVVVEPRHADIDFEEDARGAKLSSFGFNCCASTPILESMTAIGPRRK